jgi:hypothetical protein
MNMELLDQTAPKKGSMTDSVRSAIASILPSLLGGSQHSSTTISSTSLPATPREEGSDDTAPVSVLNSRHNSVRHMLRGSSRKDSACAGTATLPLVLPIIPFATLAPLLEVSSSLVLDD